MGFDFIKFLNFLKNFPFFIIQYYKFKRKYDGNLEFLPCLHDKNDEAGNSKGEYFLQDLYVAKRIFNANPIRHLDVGSSFDGFVAHVASYREIDVLDIRPINSKLPGIKFKQFDLMNPIVDNDEKYDSISCLHALEHFGLGRYGDPINIDGHEKGLENISELLTPNGLLYLSVPIGISRVEFNANRVFSPNYIIKLANSKKLSLIDFILIKDGLINENYMDQKLIEKLEGIRYALGIFIFKK
jgi:SAM-dependent methyltransferase